MSNYYLVDVTYEPGGKAGYIRRYGSKEDALAHVKEVLEKAKAEGKTLGPIVVDCIHCRSNKVDTIGHYDNFNVPQ